MRITLTEERSVRASSARSRSIMAIIGGTEVSDVARWPPMASM
jgi:hypothetical protein